VPAVAPAADAPVPDAPAPDAPPATADRYTELGRMFADVLERGWQVYHPGNGAQTVPPVAITGAALGLPGTEHIFDDANIGRILRGEQFIDVIPTRFRRAMLDKHITRLVKSDNGEATFESIGNVADVIKLAGRGGGFDLEGEFGVSADRAAALDRVTRLAIAVGIDALRDAGIPLVMRYKTTTKGTRLPDRWGLPDALRDDTGVIFASAFPGLDSFARELSHYHADCARREQLAMLENLRARAAEANGHSLTVRELDRRIDEVRAALEKEPYVFDRRFLFRVLPMGHSQFAEFIGARGPNTQVNSACASTTSAVSVAEDWIRAGRCRRVIIVSADDITTDNLIDWLGAGFLASGAAATDEVVEAAALPFDRRRHGLIMGMGAASLVVESADAVRERGIRPICEVLSAVTANSAFHGTRLDVEHISQVMESLVSRAETLSGIRRHQVASQMVFVSHETYTPARGGSASAEIHALRRVFGDAAERIVIGNTKGFTGHPMAAGIEDVVAVKALETGLVPPVANFKEVDPELGPLNLSKGGAYPIEYALRLGSGFGSQISMTLSRRIPAKNNVRPTVSALGYASRIEDTAAWQAWLSKMSGHNGMDLEVVNRTLRVRDNGQPARVPEAARDSLPVQAEQASEVRLVPVPATPPAPPAPPTLPPPAPILATSEVSPPPLGDPVKERIVALVAEKTGYPADMLDLDLDLEADLGVDTVKQAEVFAAIREAYGITRDDTIKLRDFPTLAHVIRFVHERRPDLGVTERVQPVPEIELTPAAAESPKTGAGDAVRDRILALVVEKTGYPSDMLDLDLDLEADLGIDTVKQAELFAAIRETYTIPRDADLKLRDFPTLAHVIRFVYDKRPDLAVATPPSVTAGAAAATAGASAATVGASTAATIAAAATAGAAGATVGTAAATAGAAAATAGAVAASLAAEQTTTRDSIQEKVLDIVAEKTGYPKDMLDLDLDLEADLGIDTVKQAEMFASVRTAFDIPRSADLKLRDFPTLAHVIKFARDRSSGLAGMPAEERLPASPAASSMPARPERPILASLDAANRIPRRLPVPSLRLPLAICKTTGVMLAQGNRVVIMPDRGGVDAALGQALAGMGVEVLRIERGWDADALADRLRNWLAAGPIRGVYWLPALDEEGILSDMDLPAWHEALRVRLKSLYTTLRTLYGQAPFLVSATRLGGQHGFDEPGALAPLGGAVTGFTKTYKRERVEALVKAVDFEPARRAPEIAAILVEETRRDPGAVEIGYKGGQRFTVTLAEQPAADGQPGLTLDQDTVFLITGAAGSIVSAITADLATASGGTFYLLDLVPEPDPDNPDLVRFVSDKEGLKRDLFARMQARGERATPALVEKQLQALERAQAARSAINTVRAAGGTAHYFSVNLTDADAVAQVIHQVRERSGRIDVLLHAAGLERSHFLPDKDPREFDLIFDVKADGWFNLLRAIGDMPLRATVAFSSIAGRFGNAGQTDYSSANDLLCKITSSFRTTRPATRGIAIDWTAWGSIGMATRGSIPKMMELAGIDMLPPEAGVPLVRRELTAGGTRGEVVIAERLGMLLDEWDATGGLDTDALPLSGPMTGRITGMGLYRGLTIETTLDPKVQPFLYDHQIEGIPVLPGVMGIEAFAEAASILPGWQVGAVEEVNFLAPFKFYRNEPRTLTIEAQFYPQADGLVADCRLMGHRRLQNQAEPQATTHFTARVRLVNALPSGVIAPAPSTPHGATIQAADIYRVYFHGPAYQVVERAWWDGNRVVGQMAGGLPSNHCPSEQPTLMAPRLIELCLQTAGVWEIGAQGRMGLPHYIHQVCLWRAPDPVSGPFYCVVTPDPDQESFDAEVVDTEGNVYLHMTGYRTVVFQNGIDPEPFRAVQVMMA
jgi:3-oxoacyl-(acyl-carrier-protein) synthase/acyl carrier protein/NADP-dependent 3-hydroxy acid dehydrogenase YdfG